jgi:hypothetical protein
MLQNKQKLTIPRLPDKSSLSTKIEINIKRKPTKKSAGHHFVPK